MFTKISQSLFHHHCFLTVPFYQLIYIHEYYTYIVNYFFYIQNNTESTIDNDNDDMDVENNDKKNNLVINLFKPFCCCCLFAVLMIGDRYICFFICFIFLSSFSIMSYIYLNIPFMIHCLFQKNLCSFFYIFFLLLCCCWYTGFLC